jgi:hypothetical protein
MVDTIPRCDLVLLEMVGKLKWVGKLRCNTKQQEGLTHGTCHRTNAAVW